MPVEVGGCRVGVTPATLATGEPFLPAQSAATGLGEAKEIRWIGVVVLGKSFVGTKEESGCDCERGHRDRRTWASTVVHLVPAFSS